MKKRLLSLLLVLVLVLGILPAGALAAGTNEVTVTFSYSKESAFVVPPQELTVAAGIAFEYGIGDEASTTPNLLDAVVAAHIQRYGKDFTAETASAYMNSGLTLLFGDSGYGGHIINGHYSDKYGAEQDLAQGDIVDMLLYDLPSYYGDYYAAFYQNDAQIRALTVDAGTDLPLIVKGFYIMGAYVGESWEVLSDLNVGYIAEDGSFTDLNVDTGSDGTCTVRFEKAGNYLLATQGASDSKPVVPAWCKVTVTEGLSEEEQRDAVSRDKNALTITYTDGQNLTLPTRGDSGKTSISWTSDNEAVISKTGAVTKQAQEVQVKLTATIRCGEASDIKEFSITVPALTEEGITQRLQAAKEALNGMNALNPVEYSGLSGGMYAYESEAVDTNIVTKAQGIVDKAAPGVTVALDGAFQGNEYIKSTGEIVYPSGSSKGTVNDLPFALSMGGKNESASVSGITIPIHDTTKEEAVQELMAEVTEEVVLNGQAKDQVISTLKLPVGSSYGLGVTWSSDHEAVTITRGTSSSTGQLHTITRPACGEENAVVTLTATFDYADMAKNYGLCDAGPMPEQNTKTFIFTVPAVTAEEQAAVKAELTAALETITADRITAYDKTNTSDTKVPADLDSVTTDLQLYDLGWDRENPYYGKDIDVVWSTTNQAVVVNTLRAKVTRPVGTEDATGELKVTLSKLGVSVDKTFAITVKAVSAEEVMHNIAAKYAKSGIVGDANAPWLAADLAAYAQAFPEMGAKLNQEQTQAYLDELIAKADAATAPGDLAKYVIAFRALGYDARKVVTADLREIDVVKKLTDLIDAKSTTVSNYYTLPYVLIALQQGEDYATQAQIDWLIQAALDSQSGWQNTSFGPDGATPMILALAPYCDDQEVEAAVDLAVDAVKKAQKSNGGMGSAASTGLAMAAFAAMGQDGPVSEEGKALSEGLMTQVSDTLDGFNPTSNSFSTEQGFRGLVAKVLNGRVFDFINMPMETARATWAQGCPVEFAVVPEGATVEVKLADITQIPRGELRYDLAAGSYTYTVSKDGYEPVSGTLEVAAEDAANHVAKTVRVSLAKTPGTTEKDIKVTVRVLTHDASVCGGVYTYKNNQSAYTIVLAEEVVNIKAGLSVFEALNKALTKVNVPYSEKSYGYIDSIGTEAELGHGSTKSGWQYMVGDVLPTEGCRDYILRSDTEVTWFYTDDYTAEYGSENWGGGSGSKPEEPEGTVETLFPDVKGHWGVSAIQYVYDKRLMNGVGETEFAPEATLSRGMLATVLYRMAGAPAVKGESGFSDVESKAWYEAAVIWAAENGIVKGFDDGRFYPELEVSREQAAAMLRRYADWKSLNTDARSELSDFQDAGEISTWAEEDLSWANAVGLVTGKDNNILDPGGDATRAEAATILMRFCENIAK